MEGFVYLAWLAVIGFIINKSVKEDRIRQEEAIARKKAKKALEDAIAKETTHKPRKLKPKKVDLVNYLESKGLQADFDQWFNASINEG